MASRDRSQWASSVTRRVLRGFQPERLAGARKSAGMSRGDLARLACVTTATVRNWETGRARPQIDVLGRVTRLLQLSIADLVDVDPAHRHLGDLRVLAGLTQPQLALAAGISTTQLSGLERGEVQLTSAVATRLAAALGEPIASVTQSYERVRSRPVGDPP